MNWHWLGLIISFIVLPCTNRNEIVMMGENATNEFINAEIKSTPNLKLETELMTIKQKSIPNLQEYVDNETKLTEYYNEPGKKDYIKIICTEICIFACLKAIIFLLTIKKQEKQKNHYSNWVKFNLPLTT